MELGIALPISGPYASAENIIRIAPEAERLGYHSVWTYERLLYPTEGVRFPDGSRGQLPKVYMVVNEVKSARILRGIWENQRET